MAIEWQYSSRNQAKSSPAIRDQYVTTDQELLSLKNPWIAESVSMGKLYTSFNLPTIFVLLWVLGTQPQNGIFFRALLECTIAFIIFSIVITGYRVYVIKRLSNFYFNRKTKKIYYQRNKTLISFDWATTEGGIFSRAEFGGASFSTNYALAFGPQPEAGENKKRIILWVDSNEPTDPDPRHIAEVWAYICQFMEHGPEKLPAPGEPNWWHIPLHRICLTPAEAWRHYAPWRTGEPGELQGKKLWLLPMWLVLFPYNMFSALCWYAVCRLFNVCAAPAPEMD